MSAAECGSSAEQANEWAVSANERTEERMAQYSTRRFHRHSTHRALLVLTDWLTHRRGGWRCEVKILSFFLSFEWHGLARDVALYIQRIDFLVPYSNHVSRLKEPKMNSLCLEKWWKVFICFEFFCISVKSERDSLFKRFKCEIVGEIVQKEGEEERGKREGGGRK